MVRIRLKRMGRKNIDFFRIVVADIRKPRDGTTVEQIGCYDPKIADETKKYSLDKERAAYWLSVGAQPTETVVSIFKRLGVALPQKKKRKSEWRSKVRRTSKRTLKRRAAKKLAEAKAKTAKKAEAPAQAAEAKPAEGSGS